MATAIELKYISDSPEGRRSLRTTSTCSALSPDRTTDSALLIRHRSASAINQRHDSSASEPPSYHEAESQDPLIASLPQDFTGFNPTRTFWVTPHSFFTRAIPVYDLTADISTPYTGLSSAYKASVHKALKDHSPSPCYTVTRENWLGCKYNITDADSHPVADWKHPWSSCGEAVLCFPPDSPHSTHTIALRNRRWGLRTERFVVDSVTYEWASDSLFVSQSMTLYQVRGELRREVGKYAAKWWGSWCTGGTLLVDANELDELIAVASLAVVLKKKRQRAAERARYSGGGGGGC